MPKKFSIVTSVYNTEEYLEDYFNSLIHQTIGFEKNIEIILVDDGSVDNSKNIIQEYCKKFPENVLLLDNTGSGVSDARNLGIKFAKGKYVGLIDSDDMVSENTLLEVSSFFDKWYAEIDLVAIPIHLFESQTGPHMLNYKFSINTVIDIVENPQDIQLSAASSFFKAEIIKKLKFDEKLSIGEDSKLVTDAILTKGKYGIVSSASYYYRKRLSGTSTLQNTYENPNYYFPFLQNFILPVWNRYKDTKYREYVENVLMYNLQWPLKKEKKPDFMTDSIRDEYLDKVVSVVKEFDTKTILEAKFLGYHAKNYLVKKSAIANNKKIVMVNEENDINLYYGEKIADKLSKVKFTILSIKREQRNLIIQAEIGTKFNLEEFKIYPEADIEITYELNQNHKIFMMGKLIKVFVGITIRVDEKKILKEKKRIYFIIGQNRLLRKGKINVGEYSFPLKERKETVELSDDNKVLLVKKNSLKNKWLNNH